MRCSPGRSKRSPGGRSTGGTPHGRERYHTGGVRGRSSASGEGTRGGGVGGGGGAGAQRRGGPLAAGTRIRVAAGDPGGGVDGAERTAGGERELWLRGREVAVRVQYGQCERCHRGQVPVRAEIEVDEKGFTAGLQELALLAGVLEPYAA